MKNLTRPVVFVLACIISVPASGSMTRGLSAQTLTVTNPQAGEVWLAGGQDTIRWMATGLSEVDIFYSTDFENGMGTFDNIVASYPADPGEYVWDIPDGTLSRKCAIFIRDGSNPSFSDTSDVFRIKGYVLTRVDANGDYDAFAVEDDSWDFGNEATAVWPSSWYQQFNYRTGTDPFTNSRYSTDFTHWAINAKSTNFPDWPSFVRAFGTGQAYLTVNAGGIVNPWALLYWALNKGPFVGANAGFAGTAFVAWDDKPGFLSRFNIAAFGDLREVPLSSSARRAIGQGWACQLGSAQRNAALLALTTSANDVLQQIKEMFLSESTDNMGVYYFDTVPNFPPVVGQGLNPWKVEDHPSNPDLEYIYVYDSNGPGFFTLRFEMNTALNTWRYSSYTGTFGIGLMTPSSSFLQDVNLPAAAGNLASPEGGSTIEMYTTSIASIVITNPAGNSIVYDQTDSVFSNTITAAIPIVAATGSLTPPVGYYLPEDAYSAVMSDFADTAMHFAVLADSVVLVYGRTDAVAGQQDLVSFDSGLSASNADTDSKNANFLALILGQADQKQFDLMNLTMVQNDSMHFSVLGSDTAEIVNAGSMKSYDLELDHALDTTSTEFEFEAIPLEANSTHQIVPDWIDHETVTIYIDLGNDGTIDDTLMLGGTVSVDNTAATGLPREYSLSQNYPNPFNPATVISYQLATASHVTLRVHDVLGREVATLVNEVQNAGYQKVNFDAGGLATGVYYYRIDMRSVTTNQLFRDVKKMMVVK